MKWTLRIGVRLVGNVSIRSRLDPVFNDVLGDRKKETYVMKLSSASCSFPTGSALALAPAPLAFLFFGNPN